MCNKLLTTYLVFIIYSINAKKLNSLTATRPTPLNQNSKNQKKVLSLLQHIAIMSTCINFNSDLNIYGTIVFSDPDSL